MLKFSVLLFCSNSTATVSFENELAYAFNVGLIDQVDKPVIIIISSCRVRLFQGIQICEANQTINFIIYCPLHSVPKICFMISGARKVLSLTPTRFYLKPKHQAA